MAEVVKLVKGKGQCIMHMNAQSIRNKFSILKKELKTQGVGILLFSETWLTSMNPDEDFYFEEYNLYRWDRIRHKNGGGLCAYINEDLTCSTVTYGNLNVSTVDIEIQWLKITKGKAKQMLIANIYRPPEGNKQNFITLLKGMLTKIENLDLLDVIITGDFNIDVLTESNIKDNLYSNMADFGLKQLIHEPTRNKASKTCIDLIFTNIVHITSSGVALLNISDHLPVFMTVKQQVFGVETKTFRGRSYKNYNKPVFEERFRNLLWQNFDDSQDVEYCWDIFEKNIGLILDIMCPIREFKIRHKEEPWLTPELTAQIIEKNAALKKARRTDRILDWDISNGLKNKCCTDVKIAKQSFVVDEIDRNIKDAKNFWASMKELVPSKGTKPKIINLVNSNGNEIPKDEVSSFINEFFTGIGPRLAETHVKEWVFKGTECNTLMPDIDVSEFEVVKAVKDINISKSSTLDYISAKVFRDAVLCLPQKFTKILRLSIQQQKIPKKWKVAKVTPLPKSGDFTNVSNYRPISQLPIPGKILERIVHDQIINHLNINNILTDIQGGYRKSCSTLDTISVFGNK